MFEITITDEDNNDLIVYESSIIPITGDLIAGIEFKDSKQRTVTHRLVFARSSNRIVVYTKVSLPHLYS